MGLSYDLKKGDGVTEVFPFSFAGLGKGYLVPDNLHVELRTNGTDDWTRYENWTLETTNSVHIYPAPEAPSDDRGNIRIRRVMPKEQPYTDWKVGQNYSDYMINNSFLTQLYICQEVLDGFFETEGGNIDFSASAIVFDPRGTDFDSDSNNVDKVLREIDETFIRKTGIPVDPDPDDSVPLQPNSVWLVDSSETARRRYLPALNTDIPENARILIRDDTGTSGAHNITISVMDGVTIMDKPNESLVIDKDWAWCELVYIGEGKWHIASGGVGSQIEPDRKRVVDIVYPVGSVYISTNAINPNIQLGSGIWTRICNGRTLAGAGTSTDTNGVTTTFTGRSKVGVARTVLTEDNIPQHSFTYRAPRGSTTSTGTGGSKGFRNSWLEYETNTYGRLSPVPVSAIQPSECYYIWERTQ